MSLHYHIFTIYKRYVPGALAFFRWLAFSCLCVVTAAKKWSFEFHSWYCRRGINHESTSAKPKLNFTASNPNDNKGTTTHLSRDLLVLVSHLYHHPYHLYSYHRHSLASHYATMSSKHRLTRSFRTLSALLYIVSVYLPSIFLVSFDTSIFRFARLSSK